MIGQLLRRFQRNDSVGHASTYLWSNLVNAALPLILMPVLTRFLGPDQYGEVAIFQSVAAAFSLLVGLSVAGSARVKFYEKGLTDSEFSQYLGSCIQVLFISGLCVFILARLFLGPLEELLALRPEWILLAVSMPLCSSLIEIRLGQWQVRNQSKKFAWFQISRTSTGLVLSLVLVVVFLMGSAGRILALFSVVALFASVAVFISIREKMVSLMVFRPDFIREILKFGIPLIPHFTGIFIISSADRLFISSGLGMSEAGIYMLGIQIAGVLGLLFDAANKAYFPWLFSRLQDASDAQKNRIVGYTYLYFIAAVICVLVFALVAPWLIHFLAGEKFLRASEIIIWLALGQAFSGMYLMVTNYVYFTKKTGYLSLSTALTAVVHILMLVAFIPLWGIEGAAIAFFLSMMLRFLSTWAVACFLFRMPWFNLGAVVGEFVHKSP